MAWKKAGYNTLGSANANISVTGISTNIFYQSINHVFATSGNVAIATSYNGDTATTSNRYAMRKNNNGTEDPLYSRDEIYLTGGDTEIFGIAYHVFISGEEKLMIGQAVGKGTTGAGNSPNKNEGVGKYVPTDLTDTMSSMNIEAQNSSNTYTSDSNLSVIGSDGTEELNVQDGAIYYDTTLNKEYVLYNNTWTEL